jgi:uncharacterized protein (TIGR02246 family)
VADRDLLHELNRDIWHPFRQAYGARDSEAFLALHTPDLIRAGGPSKEVYGFDEYAKQTERSFADMIARGDGVGIELRFLERIASGELASERGVFRITATRASGEQRVFHGRFHVMARKVDGRWRIAVDYDSDEGGTVTDETFATGVDIDDVAAFAG